MSALCHPTKTVARGHHRPSVVAAYEDFWATRPSGRSAHRRAAERLRGEIERHYPASARCLVDRTPAGAVRLVWVVGTSVCSLGPGERTPTILNTADAAGACR